jgi:hypothetical protein
MAETTTDGTGPIRYGGTGVEPPATPPPSLGIDGVAGLIRKLRQPRCQGACVGFAYQGNAWLPAVDPLLSR